MGDNTITLNASEETINNLASQMTDFTKAVKDANKVLLKTNNTTSDIKKSEEKIGKILDDNNKRQKDSLGLLGNAKDLLGNIVGSYGQISSLLSGASIAGFMGKLVKDTIELDNLSAKLAARMGASVSKGEIKGYVNGIQQATGAAYDKAVNLVETLSAKRFVGNIQEAASGIYLFSKGTGASSDATADLVNELEKVAQMGTKEINATLASMMKVQQTVGLSANGMNAVINYIPKMTANMKAFGKTSEEIKRITTQTTALTAEMEKVGIAAGDATEFVDKLTDPDRIEDNIMLYSQLGVSMEDAMSGNVDLSSMDGQLKEMAQKIVDMGPIAGKQFAASMGMTYKQAAEMAKMEGNSVGQVADAAGVAAGDGMDQLQQMKNLTDGIGDKLEKGINKLEGKIRALPTGIIVALALLTPAIIKLVSKIFISIADKIKNFFSQKNKEMSAITEGIGSSIAEGAQKGIQKTGTAIGAFTKNAKQWFDGTSFGSLMFGSVESRMDALEKRLNKKSFADIYFDASKANKNDAIKARLDDYETKANTLKAKFKDISGGVEFDTSDVGAAAKKGAEKMGTGDVEARQKALRLIQKQIEKITKASEVDKARQEELNALTPKQKEIQDQILKVKKEIEAQTDNITKAENALFKQTKQIDGLKNAKEELIIRLRLAKIKGDKTAVNQLEKEVNAHDKLIADMEKGAKQQEDKLKNEQKILKILEEQTNELEEQRNVAGKIKDPKAAISKIAGGIKNKISTSYQNSNFGKSAAKFGGGKAGAVKAAGSGLGKGAAKALGGLSKGLGGIMKSMGPMALVMSILGKLLDKIKEPLEEMITNLVDNLMPAIEPILKIITDTVGPALSKIITALLPPILKVLSFILKVVGFILTPVKAILKALSHLPGIGKAFEGVADTIDALTGPGMTDALDKAADSISNSSGDLTKAAKKQEEVANKEENKGASWTANGAEFVRTEAAVVNNNANSQSSSTTQVTTSSSAESNLEKLEKQKKEKKEETWKTDIKEVVTDLKTLLAEIKNIITPKESENLKGLGVTQMSYNGDGGRSN